MTHIKIRIELALFEWMNWYQDKVPEWCTRDELCAENFNIDMEYESLMTREDLQHSTKETAEQFYRRNHSVVEHFLKCNGKRIPPLTLSFVVFHEYRNHHFRIRKCADGRPRLYTRFVQSFVNW